MWLNLSKTSAHQLILQSTFIEDSFSSFSKAWKDFNEKNKTFFSWKIALLYLGPKLMITLVIEDSNNCFYDLTGNQGQKV